MCVSWCHLSCVVPDPKADMDGGPQQARVSPPACNASGFSACWPPFSLRHRVRPISSSDPFCLNSLLIYNMRHTRNDTCDKSPVKKDRESSPDLNGTMSEWGFLWYYWKTTFLKPDCLISVSKGRFQKPKSQKRAVERFSPRLLGRAKKDPLFAQNSIFAYFCPDQNMKWGGGGG